MNILFPIIVNLVLVVIFATTILTGKKLGWKASLINLVITAGATIGGYFLAEIPFIAALHLNHFSALSDLLFRITVASIVGCNVFFIETVLSFIICKHKSLVKAETLNTAKIKRAKAIDKKTEKFIRKQEKHAEKASRVYRKLSKKSSLFGVLISIVLGLLLVCMAYVQIKSACILLQERTNIEWLDEGYTYTLPGQLDKIIKI